LFFVIQNKKTAERKKVFFFSGYNKAKKHEIDKEEDPKE
jgi:hypothetical protein